MQAHVAADTYRMLIYEHAASHPWEALPRIADADGDIEEAPVPGPRPTIPPPPPPR
ncbi:hypothetical protein [Aquisphaera giovannonii]|uniref:hypothetical protein n=1 Tax=Aquisphaera giovannonii TaxID=406548 RepID=UPI00143E008D|nr:hypothetical protein [Aquisphaera giovannonii]